MRLCTFEPADFRKGSLGTVELADFENGRLGNVELADFGLVPLSWLILEG